MNISNLINIINKKKVKYLLKQVMIGLIVLLIALFFFSQLVSFLLTISLVIAGSLSKLYKRFMHSIGFELVTFASIIFFFAHGVVIGFLLALLMLIASTLLSTKITNIFIYQIIIYVILAVLSIFFRPLGIVTGGKILVILYNIMLHSVGIFLIHYPPHNSVIHFFVNTTVNFFLFEYASLWLLENL
jgi:hypothetical protein